MDGTYLSNLKDLVRDAAALSEQAGALCGRLNRMEELDEEQRAEMYAILQAMKRDVDTEAAALGGLLEAGDSREASHV